VLSSMPVIVAGCSRQIRLKQPPLLGGQGQSAASTPCRYPRAVPPRL